MYCDNCGEKLPENATVCKHCGFKAEYIFSEKEKDMILESGLEEETKSSSYILSLEEDEGDATSVPSKPDIIFEEDTEVDLTDENGTPLRVQAEVAEKENSAKYNYEDVQLVAKTKKVKIAIIIISITIIALFLVGFTLYNIFYDLLLPSNMFRKAIDREDFIYASEIYKEDIEEDEMLKKEADNIVDMFFQVKLNEYKSEVISGEEIIELITGMEDGGKLISQSKRLSGRIVPSFVEAIKNKILDEKTSAKEGEELFEKLKNSGIEISSYLRNASDWFEKHSFTQERIEIAEKHRENKEYMEAYDIYIDISSSETEYMGEIGINAYVATIELLEIIIDEEIKKSEEFAAEKKYSDAYDNLIELNRTIYFQNNKSEKVEKKIKEYESKMFESIKNSAETEEQYLFRAEKLIEDKNFIAGVYLMDNAIKKYPDNENLFNLRKIIVGNFEAQTIEKAETIVESGYDPSETLRLLQEAVALLPESEMLRKKYYELSKQYGG